MKAYGLKQLHHNHKDNHPPKGFINWWEDEIISICKKTERQKAKKELREL
jgi:hypothetical protein